MIKSLGFGLLAGMPLAATIIMLCMVIYFWIAPRPRRKIVSREKIQKMITGRFMTTTFRIVSGLAQAFAYRFAGHEGESLNEAWERWWNVTNCAIGALGSTIMFVLASLIGRHELTNSPIAYGVGLLMPVVLILAVVRRRIR